MELRGEAAPSGGGGPAPAWSPDGSKIAYIGLDGNVYLLDLATGMSTQVSDDARDDAQSPTFSPDGSSILYSVRLGEEDVGEVRIVPIAGGESERLVGGASDWVTSSRRMVRSCPTPAARDGHRISAWRTPTEPTPGCSSRGSKARGVGRPTERGSRTGRRRQVCTSWMLQPVRWHGWRGVRFRLGSTVTPSSWRPTTAASRPTVIAPSDDGEAALGEGWAMRRIVVLAVGSWCCRRCPLWREDPTSSMRRLVRESSHGRGHTWNSPRRRMGSRRGSCCIR